MTGVQTCALPIFANNATANANSAGIYANSAYVQANTPSHVANSGASYANSAYLVANSAGSYANSAYAKANTALANVTTVSSNVLQNIVGSNTMYKINNIMLTNYTTTNQSANVVINRANVGNFYIVGTVTVPGNSLLSVLGKDTAIYLIEGDTLQTYSSANSSIHLTSGYELLS